MRARALVLSLSSSAAVLVLGWQIGSAGQTTSVTPATAADSGSTASDSTASRGSSSGSSSGATTDAATPSPTSTAAASSDSAAASAGVSGTFTGSVSQTRFGNVQVQIAVVDGTITDVTALQLTDKDQRSVSISNRAAPVLRQAVLAAQSANVQGVSGATYTSDAYLTSLQSAIDQAGL